MKYRLNRVQDKKYLHKEAFVSSNSCGPLSRKFKFRKNKTLKERAAIFIQKIARGYLQRKKFTKFKRDCSINASFFGKKYHQVQAMTSTQVQEPKNGGKSPNFHRRSVSNHQNIKKLKFSEESSINFNSKYGGAHHKRTHSHANVKKNNYVVKNATSKPNIPSDEYGMSFSPVKGYDDNSCKKKGNAKAQFFTTSQFCKSGSNMHQNLVSCGIANMGNNSPSKTKTPEIGNSMRAGELIKQGSRFLMHRGIGMDIMSSKMIENLEDKKAAARSNQYAQFHDDNTQANPYIYSKKHDIHKKRPQSTYEAHNRKIYRDDINRFMSKLNIKQEFLLKCIKTNDFTKLANSNFVMLKYDVNVVDSTKSAPMHHACNIGSENFVKFLIGKGAHLNTKDGSGNTPLHYSFMRGYKHIVELLLHNGAKINITNNIKQMVFDVINWELANDNDWCKMIMDTYGGMIQDTSKNSKYRFPLNELQGDNSPQMLGYQNNQNSGDVSQFNHGKSDCFELE